MEHLNHLAHTRLRDTTTTKDIRRMVSNFLRGVRGKGLEETDRTAKVASLLGVGHVTHLVGNRFEPSLI